MNSIVLQGLGPVQRVVTLGLTPTLHAATVTSRPLRWFPGLSRARRTR